MNIPKTTGAASPARAGESAGGRQTFPTAAPALPPTEPTRRPTTGSALPLIRWASALLTLLCVALAVVTLRANGLLVLATIFLAIHLWALGAFHKEYWS